MLTPTSASAPAKVPTTPRRSLHAVAHQGDDGAAGPDLDRIEDAGGELGGEGLAQRRDGVRAVGVGDGEGDRALAGALGDQDDRDAGRGHRLEHPRGDAGHAGHAGAGDVDQRDAGQEGEAAGAAGGRGGAAVDQAAGVVGREAVAHPHRDPLLARRLDGLRVEHLGAEEGELHGLLVAHLGEHGGAGDQPRIGAVDAVDVGPDLQQLGVEGPGGDGAGVVRAAAPEEVDAAVGVAAEEPRQHGDRRRRLAQRGEGLAGGRPVGRRRQRRPGGADQRLGIEQPRVEAARGEQGGDQGAGGALAEGGEEGEGGGRALAEQAETAQQVLHLLLQDAEVGLRLGGAAGAQLGAQAVQDLAMDRVEARERRHHRAARRGLLGAAQEPVGDPADRRDHHQQRTVGRLAGDDVRHAADPLRTAYRSTAELEHSHL